MKTTKTAVEVFTEIEVKAKECAITEIRDGRGMEIGQVGRQGDIYVVRVPNDWPRGKRIENRQMAIGNTQGARHIAAGEVELYEGVKAPPCIKFVDEGGREIAPLLGPCIVVKDDSFTGTHPEHAHFWLSSGTTNQIVHQMDGRTLQRVQD